MTCRLMVDMREGRFMLLRDFDNADEATTFALWAGIWNFEVVDSFNDDDWIPLNPALDRTKYMSFAKPKEVQCA